MPIFAQFVIGPAGSGKSTYCDAMRQHCEHAKRAIHVVNLDPAAEKCNYPIAFDIRELISVDDVMEEMELGPNGGLVFCMEYLLQNLEWLHDEMASYSE
jgi:GTPase SAR1 family protein